MLTPTVSKTYQVGAILEDSWGYEQTNIDFYCIIKRSESNGKVWLVVQKMLKKVRDGENMSMSTYETPSVIDTNEKPIRKKLKVFNGEEAGFSFRDYSGGGWCRLWDGKESLATHYA